MADGWKDFVAGTVGGFAGKLLDYPLDTVKVLLQTQNVSAGSGASVGTVAGEVPVVYRGAWHCLTHTFRTKGVKGLYKGLSSPLLGSMAENAVLFLTFGYFKRLLGEVPGEKDLSLTELSLAGAGAGGVVAFVLTPVELVKCRLQVQNSASSSAGFRAYKGPVDVVVQTLKTEGLVQGLYRGHASTLLREIPGNFCWYGVYEGVCKSMIPEGGTKADLGPSAHIIGGASAGVAYWTAFYPADTVKSQLQTHPDHARHGFYETFKSIFRKEGLRGLYRGWGVTAARAAPAHAAIFAGYEYTMKLLRPEHIDEERSFVMQESIHD
eukprot:CAMPEP_0197441750 /NCGR_PEP_ID=MMETSP1175-20131217/7945_1 /TAXON_ID=1003142 /ORGANISM="Triceratium dubium, Strain CCMP147" /LENGTH=322 /DNA_ID=CAMNT_0042972081 /DNA_START=233 /DNA_END=1201 /DNA_ORIENTATION=+